MEVGLSRCIGDDGEYGPPLPYVDELYVPDGQTLKEAFEAVTKEKLPKGCRLTATVTSDQEAEVLRLSIRPGDGITVVVYPSTPPTTPSTTQPTPSPTSSLPSDDLDNDALIFIGILSVPVGGVFVAIVVGFPISYALHKRRQRRLRASERAHQERDGTDGTQLESLQRRSSYDSDATLIPEELVRHA